MATVDTRIDSETLAAVPARSVDQIHFQSLSEYACAKLLEKYTGWKGFDGITFQIQVGRAVFDFRVGDTFVEYHPISLRREFLTDALKDIMSVAHKLNRKDKLQLMDSAARELSAQYAKRRGQTLAAHPVYSKMELICVHTQEQFVDLVLRRFAIKPVSSTGKVCQEFRNLQKLKKASEVD